MKTLIHFWLFLALTLLPVQGQGILSLAGSPPTAVGFTPDLLDEDCEGTGKPAGWTDAGTPNWDYVTAPAPLQGAQSLRFGTSQAAHFTFAGTTTVEMYCLFTVASLPGSIVTIFGARDSGGAALCLARLNTTGTISVYSNGSDATFTTDAYTAGTAIHLWLRYVSGGTCTVEWATDGVRVGSGNKFASKTGGSGTAARYSTGVVGTASSIFDRMIASTTTIPSNP